MIEISSCYCHLKLESNDFTKIMMAMNEAEFRSLVWQSKLALLANAGISELKEDILSWIGYYKVNRDQAFIYRADLFVEGETIIYVLLESTRSHGDYQRIEIGVFSENRDIAMQLLRKYAKQLTTSVKSKIDGRRVRHMEFKWLLTPTNDVIDTQVTYEKKFRFAKLDTNLSQAALRIRSRETRQLLFKIAKQDPTKGLQFDGIQSLNKNADLTKLQSWNLIKPIVLIMCKENASKLRVIDTRDDLYNKDLKDVKCKKCGRLLKDELLKDVYQLSDLGKEVTRASHWMTILVTDALISKGIPLECIIWNLSEASEEVDCMIQFHDKVWIFEFKDRNFEAGDAYALHYRGVKFKANRTIILTTGKVSVEARKIFEDLSRTSSTSAVVPFYIEGIDSLEEEIGLIIKNETLLYISEKARHISHSASMDFSPVFLKIFGEYHAETRSGRKERINIFRSRLSF